MYNGDSPVRTLKPGQYISSDRSPGRVGYSLPDLIVFGYLFSRAISGTKGMFESCINLLWTGLSPGSPCQVFHLTAFQMLEMGIGWIRVRDKWGQ